MDVRTTFEDFATPHIDEIMRRTSLQRLSEAVRSPCVEFWRRRLRELPPNKMGWKSTRFWEKCADSVQGENTDTGVMLSAGGDKDSMGLRQRFYGGEIPLGGPKAGPKGVLLAIPIHSDSYGKSPADFGDELKLTARKVQGELRWYLVLDTTINKKYRQSDEVFLFRLKGQVFQEGNPAVVPTEEEFAEVCLGAITRVLDRG